MADCWRVHRRRSMLSAMHDEAGAPITHLFSRWIGPRPWPPPRGTGEGRAAIATVERLLSEHRDDPLLGPDRTAWVVVAATELADELKAGILDGALVVASEDEWSALPETALAAAREMALLRVDRAPADWIDELPAGAPRLEDLAGRGRLHAIRTELRLEARARVSSLHVWGESLDGLLLFPEVSGPLAVEPSCEE